MNPAIEYYETIVDKVILSAYDFYGASRYFHYQHSDSLHSFTAAFGTPQPRFGCFCEKRVVSQFSLNNLVNTSVCRSRYMLKLTATWQDWKQHVHPAVIRLNNVDILNGPLFLENVCKGWPAVYLSLPLENMQNENHLEIINNSRDRNVLIIERVDILKFKDIKDFTILFCPDFVNEGEQFIVKLNLLQNRTDIKVEYPKNNIEFLRRNKDEFLFHAKRIGENMDIVFFSDSLLTRAVVGEIMPIKKGPAIFVGMDCDDYRHDETEEMDRILGHFAYTQMGNFIAFRPKTNRNFPEQFPARTESWKRWIEFCKNNDIYFQFSQLPITLSKHEIVRIGEKHFAGFQIHEPYCSSFSPVVKNPPAIKQAQNFAEKKDKYIEFVNEIIDETSCGDVKIFCGDPSLLCVYLRESKVDNILCEPVSNSAMLYGAARGSGKDFGAHLPIDWYGGFPHDQAAIDRFRLLLNIVYACGGKHIYVESAAFKTNAFSRNDWEDEFCHNVRETLRNFYRFTCSDTRIGKPQVDLAFIYGNYESMFWRPDDRIPELADSGNWDDFVWGKWQQTDYRHLWRAADAWLPPLQYDSFDKNESLTKMFSGTPYGQVDVVLPYVNLSQYKAIAFLGWNTMNEKVYRNLLEYVRNGGTLFICGCHFDTRVSFEGWPEFFKDGAVSDLIGADINGKGPEILNGFCACDLENMTAKETEPLLYENTVGKGRVYFFNSYDYPYDMRLVERIEKILKRIGSDVSNGRDICIEGHNSRCINYTLWRNSDQTKVYLANVDWKHKEAKNIILNHYDAATPLLIKGGEMNFVVIDHLDNKITIESKGFRK